MLTFPPLAFAHRDLFTCGSGFQIKNSLTELDSWRQEETICSKLPYSRSPYTIPPPPRKSEALRLMRRY